MTTTAPTTTNGTAIKSRMSLAHVRSGKLDVPLRVFLYGVEGVGKSTFAARAPKPIFLGADAGTENLAIDRLPEPRSWDEVLEGLRLLQREKHEYQTLVLDPVNWLEPLCWERVCAKNKWPSIEEPGFGKGYTAALDEWRAFVVEVERLWSERRMHIIMLGHCRVKLYKNPTGEDYDRYTIPMHETAAGLLKQWCAFVLFARHEAFVNKDAKTKRVRGVSDGTRTIHTEWNAAWDAKNRADLPPELPLSWDRFVESVKASKDREAVLRGQIADGVNAIGDPEVAKKVAEYLREAGDDVGRLAEIANAVATKLNEKTGAQSA